MSNKTKIKWRPYLPLYLQYQLFHLHVFSIVWVSRNSFAFYREAAYSFRIFQ